jgi:hypothetical protein
MNPIAKTRVSCLLAVVVCSLFGVGAPPSEIVRGPSVWLQFEPVMVASLVLGALLALIAFLLSLGTPRAGAYVCMAAVVASTIGMIIAWGINAEAGWRALVFPIGFLAAPALGAAEALRAFHHDQLAAEGAAIAQSAG